MTPGLGDIDLSKDPHSLSGSDLLNASVGKGATSHKEIFAKSKGGGGMGRASKPAPTNKEPEEDLIQEPDQTPPQKVYPVKISNPKWLAEEAFFGDTVKVVVDIEIPESHAHLTRVTLVLNILGTNGKKEQVSSVDVHAKDGKVEGEFNMNRPENLKPGESIPFVFTASHREASKEVESPKLHVTESLRNLICELDDHSDISKNGYTLVLKGGGTVHTTFSAKDGVDKEGVLTFDFKGLDPDVKYVLELQNEKGKVVAQLFSEMKHGDWVVKNGNGKNATSSSK